MQCGIYNICRSEVYDKVAESWRWGEKKTIHCRILIQYVSGIKSLKWRL